jgi:predicted RNA-binding protein YlxR (DUF448 family)
MRVTAQTGRSAEDREVTLRTCAVTRLKRSPEELIRFVEGPDGQIVPDLARRLPGRGVWVTAERAAVAEAVRKNAFARSLRHRVVVPPDLPDLVERLLRRRALEALALANKAGLVTSGFERVDAQLAQGAVAVLLHAQEAAEDGATKLDRKLRAATREGRAAGPVICAFTSDELSLALGRPNVVHAALSAGGATGKFLNEASRLIRYGSGSSASRKQYGSGESREDHPRAGKV